MTSMYLALPSDAALLFLPPFLQELSVLHNGNATLLLTQQIATTLLKSSPALVWCGYPTTGKFPSLRISRTLSHHITVNSATEGVQKPGAVDLTGEVRGKNTYTGRRESKGVRFTEVAVSSRAMQHLSCFACS